MNNGEASPGKWKYAYTSVIGTSHSKFGIGCQDTSLCTELHLRNGSDLILAVVADGAGSAQKAELGSSIATRILAEYITDLFASGGIIEDISRDLMLKLVRKIQAGLFAIAETERADIK